MADRPTDGTSGHADVAPETADRAAAQPASAARAAAQPASAARRPHRRVRTAAVAGSDPTPQNEPPRHAENENDDRLTADKPPHWG